MVAMDLMNKLRAYAPLYAPLLVGCLCSGGMSMHGYAAERPVLSNVVELSASASVEMQQDWLTLTLSATKEGAEPAAVQTQLRQALEAALTEVKKTAQAKALDVHTGAFSLQPRYGRDNKINGWTGSADVVLEGNDFARIGSAAARAQSMTIRGLAFSLSQDLRNKAAASAQTQAIERFKTKATDIAKGFGFTGYGLRQVNVSTDDPVQGAPVLMMHSKMAISDSAPVPMEAGKSSVVITVSGTVQLR